MKKIAITVLLVCASISAYADQAHHNLTVNVCRASLGGDLQIIGVSDTDNQSKNIMFANTVVKEKIIDRYLSLCLTSFASGTKLRIDYLDCNGAACVTTTNTTLSIFK